MPVSITLPGSYGYVILSTVIGSFATNAYMGGQVMNARTKYNVEYPNLYAVPGFHKEADNFNRVQRGHQAYFEQLTFVTLSTLIAGIQYPIAAAICNMLYNLGSIFFQIGYADTTLDVSMARYQRGGGLKWVGFLGSMGMSVNIAGKMLGWWTKAT